jgi:diguanylate cyclase (GGDEF)-like protein
VPGAESEIVSRAPRFGRLTSTGTPEIVVAALPIAATDGVRARDVSATMRRARGIGVVFVLVQFLLYRPPPGGTVPFPRLPVGLAVAGVLVAINLFSWFAARHLPAASHRRIGIWELVLDSAVIVGVIWLFSFDPTSALWALLTIAVIEGALRAELRGALMTCALLTAAYIPREIWASHHVDGARFDPASITYRLGIVLIVAVATGSMARTMRGRVAAQQAALAMSEHRSGLLRTVAAVSRDLSVLDGDDLLRAIVDAALSIGFDAAEVCMYSADNWRSVCGAGTVVLSGEEHTIDSGLAGAVWKARQTVVVKDYSTWSGAVAPFSSAGFHVTVGTPIFARGTLVGTLIGGSYSASLTSANQIESVELLAAQAGASLATAAVLDRMREQAMHDSLTGLPNDALLRDRAHQAIAQASRTGDGVAFCFLDLDRFKKVNDSLGHDTGDDLLKQVAARLLKSVRAADTVARLGGDEFLVMLPGVAGSLEAVTTAEKLADALRRPFLVRDQELYITASLGVSVYPDDGEEPETLRKHADLAMYEAKARGRNTVQRYHRVMRMAPEALELEAELHRAIANSDLELHFQPEVDVASGQIVAAEALIRWRHPRQGLLHPAQFLHIAEESDLLCDLDAWVARRASDVARRWHDRGHSVRIAVNLSDATFRRLDRLRAIADIVVAAEVPPGSFEIEVTETVAGRDLRAQIDVLEALRDRGVAITIDDFGIGYSMLGRLREFPVDRLKIDRSFIGEIQPGRTDVPVVSAIVAMAANLGIEVVAEGVETWQQLDVVRRIGCAYAQGFVLGAPTMVVDGPRVTRDVPPWPARPLSVRSGSVGSGW